MKKLYHIHKYILSILREFYNRQNFFPGMYSILFNPFYFARKNLAASISDLSSQMKGNLLDVGCGTKPYRKLFKVDNYCGLDIDSSLTRNLAVADDFYDGNKFPYQSSTFDSVLCNQVLEHIFTPDDFLKEINRVMKCNAILLLTVPFIWDEHEQPHDYARYSSFGLRALLEKNGFKIIEHRKLGADATVLFQLINAYLFKISLSWPRTLKFLFKLTIMALINLFGVLAGKLLPVNPDLYLDQLVLAEKI